MKRFLPLIIAFAVCISATAQSGVSKKQTKKENARTSVFTQKQTKSVSENWQKLLNLQNSTTLSTQSGRQNAPAATADIPYTDVAVPLDTSFTFNQANTVDMAELLNGDNFRGVVFKFTLTEITEVSITTEGEIFELALFIDAINLLNLGSSGSTINVVLRPGDYYVALVDFAERLTTEGAFPVHFKIDVLNVIHTVNYWELNYSQPVALGTEITGSTENMATNVDIMNSLSLAASYSFAATAGKTYKITTNAYFQNRDDNSFMLAGLHEDLTHDFWTDDVAFYGDNYTQGTSLSIVSIFNCTQTETVKLLLATLSENVFYTFKIEELTVTSENPSTAPFAFAEMTLPFLQTMHFDTNYNNAIQDEEYGTVYKFYHLRIAEKITLQYISGSFTWQSPYIYLSVPLAIYSDADLQNDVAFFWGAPEEVILTPGDYYLVFNDQECYNDKAINMVSDIYIDSKPTNVNVLSLDQLLNATDITVVNWNSSLPYSDAGYWNSNISTIYNDDGTIKFAKAYKLTNMPVGANVNIHIGSSQDSYLYVYKKESDGTFTLVDEADDGWNGTPAYDNNYDSYLDFHSGATQMDYYIIATMYPTYNTDLENSPRVTTIWQGAAPAGEPAYGEPNLGEIVRTAASATTLNFTPDVTPTEIKAALLALDITATTASPATFAVANNPFAWVINEDTTVATFINFEVLGYTIAANYQPATVQLAIANGINDVYATNLKLYPNPVVDFVEISGLNGSETIVLIDLNGKILSSVKANGSTQNISVSGLQNGAYLVAIKDGTKINVLKLIKK